MTYLLDSDVIIDHLRKKRRIQEIIGGLEPGDRLACSVISLAEVYSGMLPNEETLTHELLDSLIHITVTKEIAEKAAEIKRQLQKHGRAIGLIDCLIASTAILEHATLVTFNSKHYPTVHKKIP
ncbi:MAG: type II toxin-antitoxin system VapC family toxin [Elusimicrobia bacterium]|nr:type II toxin-antitoxin system VapC family toxin [Elusimicrobiota bacterium]